MRAGVVRSSAASLCQECGTGRGLSGTPRVCSRQLLATRHGRVERARRAHHRRSVRGAFITRGRTVSNDLSIDGRGIVKTCGDVCALRGADFAISAYGVVRLAGGNGAGNNTLTSVRAAVMLLDPKPLVMRGEAPCQRGRA